MIQKDACLWVDVRTPAEFEQGHIFGAVNLPLFSNEERVEVGTIYARCGKEAAVEKGLQLLGPRLSILLQQGKKIAQNGKLCLYCWRGGMRSSSMAWLFSLIDMKVEVFPGGYKAYRQEFSDLLKYPWKFIVLAGPTACGKTDILHALADKGEQVLDLEGLARHKGSVFGGLDFKEQPNNETMANLLHHALSGFEVERPVWCEGESLNIGRVVLPLDFFACLQKADTIWVDGDKTSRLGRVLAEYGTFSSELLVSSFEKIRKRLGYDITDKAINYIQVGDIASAALLALNYYDKQYAYSLQQRSGKTKIQYDGGSKSAEIMSNEILNLSKGLEEEKPCK
ncbi:MAG: tRNA 2-selenouridine(34) synthase MnmH [Bacteroidales bacterium]